MDKIPKVNIGIGKQGRADTEDGKLVTMRDENTVMFTDGTAKEKCIVCGKWEEVTEKRADRLHQTNGSAGQYTCPSCWRDQQSKGKDDKLDDIYWGQALNLAVLFLPEKEKEMYYVEDGSMHQMVGVKLERLQLQFYEYIKTHRPPRES